MNVKRRISLAVIVALILLSVFPITASSAVNKIKMVINGQAVDMSPVMIEGRVLVPLRSVAESLGAEVTWENDSGTVEVTKGFKKITLNFYGSQSAASAYINRNYTNLDVPAQVIKGTTYVPARIIGEGLGADVQWNAGTSTVNINLEVPKDLEGLAATVRDAAYTTIIAKSSQFNFDAQVKIPAIPQLNMIKFNGSKDSSNAYYGTGHLLGWPLEFYTSGKDIYVKNQVFNNVWTNLTTYTSQDYENLRSEAWEQSGVDADFYGFMTELVRAFGDPKVAAEETVGGVLCQKIEFSPNKASAKSLLELETLYDGLEKASMVIWIGKDDKLMHKVDLRVDFTQENFKTNQKEPGFANIVAEFSDVNKDIKVSKPEGIN